MNTIETHLNSELQSADFQADIDFERRFGGVARLYGKSALERFRTAHVCVVGVGGVGSWIVEALARTAIGKLTLIDLDNVAESNINRQIQALSSTIGQAKIDALKARIDAINPFCEVTLVEDFIEPDNLAELIGGHGFDYVVDAIDSVKAKAALVAFCRDHALPLVMIGSAGGQVDPTKIAVRDLARTEQEPLLKKVRKILRSHYGFARGEKAKYHIDAVFSMEPLRYPEDDPTCSIDGDERHSVTGLNCAGFGSSMVVTATFGMIAASHVLNQLAASVKQPVEQPVAPANVQPVASAPEVETGAALPAESVQAAGSLLS
jgi:tRNA A37 threonylcarbamoyladenosine dehydratase